MTAPWSSRTTRGCLFAASMALPMGCAHDNLQPDAEAVHALVRESTGFAELHDPAADPLAGPEGSALLVDGLDRDEAVRLALLHNRPLQAGFAELGVARAEQVQAGLLQNPELGLAAMFPPAGPGSTRLVAELVWSVMDLWRVEDRRRQADSAYQLRVLELARQAGALVAEVRVTHARAVAARAAARVAERLEGLAVTRHELLTAQHEQGVATRVARDAARLDALQALQVARQARSEASTVVRELAALLGARDDLNDVELVDDLAMATALPDREALVTRALASRLDLRAVVVAVQAAEQQVAVERGESWPDVDVGLGYESLELGPPNHVLGPTVSLELPVFDDNAAGVSRAEYEWLRMRRLYEGLEIDVRQQVRAASDRAQAAMQGLEFVRAELGPQAERLVAAAREAQSAGQLSRVHVLERELAQAEAERALQVATLEAALALAELERAVGAPLAEGGG